MLFAIIYHPVAATEEGQLRNLQVFANWTPPGALKFLSHYAFVTGGGVAIVETESAEALLEGIIPFTPFFDFKPSPVVDMNEAIPIAQRAFDWRSSVE